MWRYNYSFASHDQLMHASKYYDPDKAHEYYEKNKETVTKTYKKDIDNGYSNPYYDPEKAHEYYERTKQLKGKNTAKVEVEQEDVKEEKTNAKKSLLQKENERYKQEQLARTDATKRTMTQHRLIMNQRINSIQNIIKRMPEKDKNSEIPKLKALIQKLKDDNEKKRKSIQEKYETESKKSNEEHILKNQQIREKFKKKTKKEE